VSKKQPNVDSEGKRFQDPSEAPSKIPKNAELAFKGVIWDIYHWKEKMFDGSEEVFEGLKKRGSVKIVALAGSKVIMTKEQQPGSEIYYSLLGGAMNDGERPLDCAKRELLEEAGMVSDQWELLQIIDVLKYPRIDFFTHLFIAKDCRKTMRQKLDIGEKIEIIETSFDQFIENMHQSSDRAGGAGALLNDKAQIDALRARLGI
jgi:ADP-ribose pyrophosphatase